MPQRTKYITGRSSEFDEFREGSPIHLESGGFFLCTSGSSDIVVDSKQYSIKACDLIVAFPYSYAHTIHRSPDFDGVIFGVGLDVLISADIDEKSFYITTISNNPCISLHPDEVNKILKLRDMFLRASADRTHPLRDEIDEAVIKIIIYEIAALYHHSKPNVEHERSRDDIIFNNFLIHLHCDETMNRTIEHFAQMQSITPGHLSKVVKRVSNRTASQWISDRTIIYIKRLLQDDNISIASIADRLNFPNASFLSQYFKKHTHQSPKYYRAEFFGRATSETYK